jgi:hypothetical protein
MNWEAGIDEGMKSRACFSLQAEAAISIVCDCELCVSERESESATIKETKSQKKKGASLMISSRISSTSHKAAALQDSVFSNNNYY